MKKFPKPWYRPSRGVWFVTLDGKQVNLGADRDAAFQQYARLLGTPRSRELSTDSLVGLIDAFLDWVQKHRAADTYEWYRHRLERFAQCYPEMRIGELKPFHAQRWVDQFAQLSRTTRRNYLRTIKRCCKWAVQQGYLPQDPLSNLEMPGAERRQLLITLADYERLLKLIRDEDFRDLIVTTWESGCRPQESLRVEARHVDLARQRWIFPQAEAKGKREPRIVYLSDIAAEITRRRLRQFPSGPLFRNSQGRPWTTEAVSCQFNRLRIRLMQVVDPLERPVLEGRIQKLIPQLAKQKQTGKGIRPKTSLELRLEAHRKVLSQHAMDAVPRYSLYALRHAWATRALQSGLDGLTVAILMGHSDPSTLAKVYQHLAHQPEHLLAQARKAAGG